MSAARRPHHRLTLAVLALGTLAYSLAQTMVAPALPEIEEELSASTTTATWVLTAYLLGAAVATPIAGRLGDMFGKERLLVLVQGGFALGLLLAALASTIELLIAVRVIQAICSSPPAPARRASSPPPAPA